MNEHIPAAPPARPYFIPPGIDFQALPLEVQIAFRQIVEPAYQELVLGALTGLERSAGATLVFLLAQEILEQFSLGRQMDFSASHDSTQVVERDKRIHQYLKLVSSKQQAANFVMRLKTIRKNYGPFGTPPEFASRGPNVGKS